MLSSFFYFQQQHLYLMDISLVLMKKELTRKEAEQKVKEFFEKERLDSKQTKKIKRIAMKYRIRLGEYKRRFCKKCFSDLRNGKTRISKGNKTVVCPKCNYFNRWKIS
jgi:RNase P subunit RPR2